MERMIMFEWLLVVAGVLDGLRTILLRHDMGVDFFNPVAYEAAVRRVHTNSVAWAGCGADPASTLT